jgi:phospho-N-acetylmuramoyl-pentapeptide-transferase
MISLDVIKILMSAGLTFIIGMLFTPLLTRFLYKKEMWKKLSVQMTLDGKEATISQQIHNDENKKTPRMGGIVVWGSVLFTTIILACLAQIFDYGVFDKISFLSRNQTWLPLFTLIITAICGLLDDYLVCRNKGGHVGGGLSLRKRLFVITLVAMVGAFWFYTKLELTSIIIPFIGEYDIGYLLPILFIVFMIGIYSGGIIDGVDGLAGGVFAIMFSAYGLISFLNDQIDLAAFCLSIVGGLLVFLWFNIPPARFYLSETGTMALTTTLVVVAFLTKEVLVLLVIAFPLIVTSASSLIQILSKKFRGGKKVFLVAPLHNHFQAKGWPPYKVTMRYWVVSVVFAFLGIIIALIN